MLAQYFSIPNMMYPSPLMNTTAKANNIISENCLALWVVNLFIFSGGSSLSLSLQDSQQLDKITKTYPCISLGLYLPKIFSNITNANTLLMLVKMPNITSSPFSMKKFSKSTQSNSIQLWWNAPWIFVLNYYLKCTSSCYHWNRTCIQNLFLSDQSWPATSGVNNLYFYISVVLLQT